jgi:hypothetical protein
MSLDTQQFGMTRHWLSVALQNIQAYPDLFVASRQLSKARKLFLAGSKQLIAIKNWLTCAGIVEGTRGQVRLTELGQLMFAQEARAEAAWTWWLFHLHLCVSDDSFPYSAFFQLDADGRWMSLDDVVSFLATIAEQQKLNITKETVNTYFGGVAQTFRPSGFVHNLGLVEERTVDEGRGRRRVRRGLASPEDVVVAYAAVLLQKECCNSQATVEAREMLNKGLGRILGMKDSGVREALTRVSTDRELSRYVQYRQQVNQDSIQFPYSGEPALRELRIKAYQTQSVKWQ